MSNANGPTLNPSYNQTLAKWAADGHDAKPECEECGKDLTGQHVVETGVSWLCNACAQAKGRETPSCERASASLNYVGGGYAIDSSGNYREAFWAGTA